MTDLVRVSLVEHPARRAATSIPAVLVVAVAIAVDPWGLRSFTSLRWALVSVGVVAVAAATGIARPSRLVAAAGTIVVGSMALSAPFGLDPTTAWLGHPQRHLGVLAWGVFAVAVGAGARLAAEDRVRATRHLALGALAGGALTGLVTVTQVAGWKPLGVTFADDRLGGLFGQPTTLAAFVLLIAPLCVVAPAPRGVRVAVVGALAVTLALTQTRGALVGLGAMGVVGAPAWWPTLCARASGIWRDRAPIRTRTVIAVGIVVVISVALVAPMGLRMLDAPGSGRLDEWRLASRVIAAHPVLGVGPDGYRIAVLAEIDPGYAARHGRSVVIDRAHSAPLDVAATGGVAAGLAYVVLLGAVAAGAQRLARRRSDDRKTIACAAGLGAIGCLSAGLVAFPVPEVDAVAWLLAGLCVAAARTAAPTVVPARVARSTAVLGTVVLATVVLVAGVTDVVADRAMRAAGESARNGDVDGAIAAADRATSLRPDLVDSWYVAARVAARGPTLLDVDAALDRIETGLERFPGDPALADLEVELLTERAVRSGLAADRIRAERAIGHLAVTDPTSEIGPSQRLRLTGGGRRNG